jgi:hypothetical protein
MASTGPRGEPNRRSAFEPTTRNLMLWGGGTAALIAGNLYIRYYLLEVRM